MAGGALSERSGFHFRASVLLLLGLVALLGAVAVRLGWARRFRPDVPTTAHRRRRLSPATAAAAGVLTHLPGVFYIAALSAITGAGAAATGTAVQVEAVVGSSRAAPGQPPGGRPGWVPFSGLSGRRHPCARHSGRPG